MSERVSICNRPVHESQTSDRTVNKASTIGDGWRNVGALTLVKIRKPHALSLNCRLLAVSKPELTEDRRDVMVNGSLRDHEPRCNLAIPQSSGHQGKDLLLPRGQVSEVLARRRPWSPR